MAANACFSTKAVLTHLGSIDTSQTSEIIHE